jgi:DNA adenine methylase
LKPEKARLSDKNVDLINFYNQIRDNVEDVISSISKLQNNEVEYYRIRQRVELDPVKSAARFLYLSSLSFNGIYRLNLNGEFNVPYGHKKNKIPYDPSQMRLISKVLARAKIECLDFDNAVTSARPGDTIYFDPPYTVAHGNNGFVKYNDKIFSWKDQERLAATANSLSKIGCKVIVSNADHPSIYDLYSNFRMIRIERVSLIAANSKFRKAITEFLFFN